MKPGHLILIGGHLATAPRPQKEAAAAKAAGFDVEIRGVWWDEDLAREDLEIAGRIGVGFQPVADLRPSSSEGRGIRLRQRLARELYQRLGIVSARSFGVGAREMLREALQLKADFTMVHSEAGLWVGKKLMARGFRVGADFEDWFSEDLPEVDRKGRPIAALKELEHHLLRSGALTLATTEAMAGELARSADVEKVPLVIPNCFPVADAPRGDGPSPDKRSAEAVSFYWFSQTIGPGRGLESVGKALSMLAGDWELHLRGNLRCYDRWFEEVFPATVRDRVKLQAPVANRDLAAHSASHDVGLALEVPHCPSRDLTATNKIFEYLRCGLAVIATETRGQREIMEKCPDAGLIIPPDDPSAVATAMQGFVDDQDRLLKQRAAARVAAEQVWAWESFAPKLVRALQQASR